MGWCTQIFKKNPKVSKIDPVFGAIVYEQHCWSRIPARIEDGFMIVIDAPEHGPSQAQREYFQSILKRLPQLVLAAKQHISTKDPHVPIAAFSIYSLEIGNDMSIPAQTLVLEFSDEAADKIHRVEFSGGSPHSYSVDC